MKLNCVENEQVSYFQLNFLSKAKLITFANHTIDEKHIFVYLCTCGGCTCTYVHMCLDAGVDMAVFLNHSLFVSQGLSLNLELTDWLDCLAIQPWDISVSAFPLLGLQAPPKAFHVGARDLNPCPYSWVESLFLTELSPQPLKTYMFISMLFAFKRLH